MRAMGEAAIDNMRKSFVAVTYGQHEFSSYPRRLAREIVRRLSLPSSTKLLDLGCGRGEFLQGFLDLGLDAVGVDQTPVSELSLDSTNYIEADLEMALPFPDNSFDVVFSKSVVEHFYYPENLMAEVHRILKKGGTVVTMTPSWRHNMKIFFNDFTHRTPFSSESLRDLHLIAGFQEVEVNYFFQLPLLWKFPLLKFLTVFPRLLIPPSIGKYSKTVRFSKELMLFGTGRKGL